MNLLPDRGSSREIECKERSHKVSSSASSQDWCQLKKIRQSTATRLILSHVVKFVVDTTKSSLVYPEQTKHKGPIVKPNPDRSIQLLINLVTVTWWWVWLFMTARKQKNSRAARKLSLITLVHVKLVPTDRSLSLICFWTVSRHGLIQFLTSLQP